MKMVIPITAGGRRWRRPYRLGVAFYAFVVFLLFVEYQAVLIVAAVVRGEGVPLPAKVAIAVGVVAVPLVVCLRGARVGLYVGDAGLRYAGMLRTVTVPWRDVESVDLQDGPMPRQVVIRRTDGQAVPLGLLFGGSAFLFGGPSTSTISGAANAELALHRR
jgi:hypothetical protein